MEAKVNSLEGLLGSTEYKFSSTLKRSNVILSEDCFQVRIPSNSEGHSIAVVEPSLSKYIPSRIAFRIRKNGYIAVGICLKYELTTSGFKHPGISK